MSKIRFKDYLIDYLEYHNITNKDFSSRIDVSQKHLIDILSGKIDMSSQVIDNVSFVTNIPAEYIHKIEFNYKLEKKIETYLKQKNLTQVQFLNKFNYRFLIKNKYIELLDSTDKTQIIKDIVKFLRTSSPELIYELENKALFKSKNNKPELLLLWLEKCYRETLKQEVEKYNNKNINYLVDYISNKALKNEFDEKEIISTFNEKGIFLVIEDDIPGLKIRGAFKVLNTKPAIYITRKHKRIADIYFALLHELAHCKSNYNEARGSSIVSYEEDIEDKADNKAFNWMVPDKYYNDVCIKDGYNINDEEKYPKSFIVYRLANDKKIKYSSMEYQNHNFVINKKQ